MKTATSPLYINDNGMLCCIDHGGCYLQSEYQHAPNKRTYRTPLDTWEKVDDEFTALWVEEMGTMPTCELCR